jgi:hypothetical protein
MRKAFVALLLLAVSVGVAPAAFAQDNVAGSEPGIVKAISGQKTGPGVFGTANSNCVAATCDTVWVGHGSSGPGGAYLGVSVGGLWDFDDGIAGTDSTQGWQRWAQTWTSNGTALAVQRPAWALNYGNVVNEGNQNLWDARTTAGRKFVKSGIAGVWHSSTLAGVKTKLNDNAEPSAAPIVGGRSAWCGLRESGNQADVDALTGNYINGDLYSTAGAAATTNPDFPGFVSLWDQMLYKDFPSTGTGTISFRLRTDMSTFIDNAVADGSGWFDKDPTSIANFVKDPADSFMVYVGSPNDAAYDINRRWISEVLDYSKPRNECFAVSGKYPFANPDTALTVAYSGIQPISGNVRVVFRVKTNRARADGVVGTATAYNSKDGAAVLDAVQVDGGTTYGFESASDITARSLAGNIASASSPWVTTGKPPSTYFHVANIATLLYEDLCGAVGASTRRCSLAGNCLVAGDADNNNLIAIEFQQMMESPTINLAVRSAAPGTKNAQGIDQQTASRTSVVEDYDIYSGFMSLDESVFWRFGGRYYGGGSRQPQSLNPCWSPWQVYPFIVFQPDPFCIRDLNNLSAAGVVAGTVDSMKVFVTTITQGFRFGGTNLGNTRGTYFDNVRVGLVRGGDAPALSQEIWNKYQDAFTVNEPGVPLGPGDNAQFDTTTAYIKTGLNIVAPATARGVVAGDSILINSPFVGDGIATGVRLDLIFRIDPGPGNYSVKGNRASALVERDVAHPFWATYKANNGPYGTPGGHGAFWNRNVWNSCRMDSADANLYAIVSRNIGGPGSPVWSGTIHEQDPNFNTLGISHNLCFLTDPNGTPDMTNLTCDGSVPAPYGAVSGQTKENTKILPDGYFTPGTHIEYFVRRTLLENAANITMLFDTTNVAVQDAGSNPDFDQERWSNVDVLPDMWKSTRYGGAGLACLLMVDGNDRRGADPQYRGAADSLGYGKNNGATAGWKRVSPMTSTEDPAGFVAANLGQYGLNFDHYDIRASESSEAGHPGVRFATNPALISLKGDKSGPSAAELAALYTTVLHLAGDLNSGTLHDGSSGAPSGFGDPQESASDIRLYEGFMTGATPSNRRGVWLSGDGIMEDAFNNSDDGTFLYPFVSDNFGSDLTSTNFKNFSSLAVPQTVGFLPTAPWAHPGRVYGFNNICLILADVLDVIPTVDGATEGSQYQNVGPGPFTASVYRPTGATRDFRTLIDGFDLSNLRGNYQNLGQIATMPENDIGRIAWFDDVVAGHFQICVRRGPIIGVGDLPGSNGSRFSNANLGSFPNPAFAGRNVTLRFTLAKAQDITVRIYNVAGREVANFTKKGVEGPNSIIWNGAMSNGAKATAGVYFYAIDGIDFVKDASKAQKMILLGANAE